MAKPEAQALLPLVAHGYDFPKASARIAQMAETIQIRKSLLTKTNSWSWKT